VFSPDEIDETIRMITVENLDIRTVTLGMSLFECATPDADRLCEHVYDKVVTTAASFVDEAGRLEERYGLPIVNKRLTVTPIACIIAPAVRAGADAVGPRVASTLDKAADAVNVDLIGGYSALVQRGFTLSDAALIASLPEVLSTTKRVCASLNVADTTSGLNMDAVLAAGRAIVDLATRTERRFGCAKLVVLCNAPDDVPFMAGGFHGISMGEYALNVGISGPGVIEEVVRQLPDADVGELAEAIKRTSFKITRAGQLIGEELAAALHIPFGSIDLSLAPSPKIGDSVAAVLEAIGLERVGAPGTTAALALLTDAVKKGGQMASSSVGGYSGAFIPVSEDQGMVRAVKDGALTLEKLEAMTAVCSVGLDMIAIPFDTPIETICGIIADEMMIGVVNRKATGVRIIPIPDARPGETVDFGGLFGTAIVMQVNKYRSNHFIHRGGRIPPPLTSLNN
jgi:uncharacterized protein (UPF0210 family)